MACPSLPTCGLGLAESERMLPGMIDRIEKLCDEVGLANEEIIIRSTGCPNGCARPYMAEIAFVGKAPGRYQVWLGGNSSGTRLNRVWKDVIKEAELETELRPVLVRFVKERNAGERFGDWCDRVFLNERKAEWHRINMYSGKRHEHFRTFGAYKNFAEAERSCVPLAFTHAAGTAGSVGRFKNINLWRSDH